MDKQEQIKLKIEKIRKHLVNDYSALEKLLYPQYVDKNFQLKDASRTYMQFFEIRHHIEANVQICNYTHDFYNAMIASACLDLWKWINDNELFVKSNAARSLINNIIKNCEDIFFLYHKYSLEDERIMPPQNVRLKHPPTKFSMFIICLIISFFMAALFIVIGYFLFGINNIKEIYMYGSQIFITFTILFFFTENILKYLSIKYFLFKSRIIWNKSAIPSYFKYYIKALFS